MPVTMDLRENGHVLYVVVSDPWNMADIERITGETGGGIRLSSHPIHMLVNVQRARHIPKGLLTNARNPVFRLPTMGQFVIVGSTPLLRGITQTVFRIAGFRRGHFFDSEGQALAYLRQVIAGEG